MKRCTNPEACNYRNANNLDKQTRMLLTSVLIQCHFNYGSSMWYTGTTCGIQITQNKVIQFILGLPSISHIGVTEFSSACMLPTYCPLRVDQLKLNHMYNVVNGISPHYLRGEVSMAGNHGHNTRSGNRTCFVLRVNIFAIKYFIYLFYCYHTQQV